MTLWFGVALMTAAAVWAVLWPLARRATRLALGQRRRGLSRPARGDRTRPCSGLIGRTRRRARRSRFRAGSSPRPTRKQQRRRCGSATWRRRAVAVAALILLPARRTQRATLALGSPSLPDQPLATRSAGTRGNPSLDDTLIAQVEDHLSRHPEDGAWLGSHRASLSATRALRRCGQGAAQCPQAQLRHRRARKCFGGGRWYSPPTAS
jgi:cytochrome c-type biogenesis protein CcmH